MTSRILLLAAVLAAPLAACKKSSLLDGNGHEAASLNAVERAHARPADEVWRAVVASAQELGLSVDRDRHDALGGELEAKRANGDRVEIEARSLDASHCRLIVYVLPGDRNMAEQIQDHISMKLGGGPGKGGLTAGSSVEGVYEAALDVCVAAARKAADALKFSVTRRDVHDTWALIECRQADSIPLEIRMDRTRKDETRVVFMAGSSRSDDMVSLARRLKNEFERSLP